jgi:hypothetical protein
MKTRQELILDFMLALSSNYAAIYKAIEEEEGFEDLSLYERIYSIACMLTDVYLEGL